ncbi:hypothetical protein [Shimazuella kribbensis]|uniref:hypothetical protein n=1 Tax=Shimazuella kribbensis TaxID=139808 RepID=UPI0003FDE700|nr:hypothetical protein [Shimazuella kribbensis]
MSRKFSIRVCPIFAFVLFFALTLGLLTQQASASPVTPFSNLKIATVDGQTYNPAKHKNIVAFIVYRNAVNGKQVLGFSTFQKYQAYKQQHLKPNTNVVKAAASSYFYEHTSFDSRGLGAYISLPVGSNYYYVGDSWNDRISSVDVYPSSSVTFYQHWHYEGYYLTLVNNGSNYWFRNLTSYNMPNGTNWNDQTSSITSGW